ncbi:Hypothetical predicted protein, partial [Olea europaea subsp. europaea]
MARELVTNNDQDDVAIGKVIPVLRLTISGDCLKSQAFFDIPPGYGIQRITTGVRRFESFSLPVPNKIKIELVFYLPSFHRCAQ